MSEKMEMGTEIRVNIAGLVSLEDFAGVARLAGLSEEQIAKLETTADAWVDAIPEAVK